MSRETVCFSWNSRHVDDGHEALAAVDGSASASAVSVLPTPEGPTKSSTPTGWFGLLMPACEMRMVSATTSDRVVLAAHALVELVLQREQHRDVVLLHLADGDARPVADDACATTSGSTSACTSGRLALHLRRRARHRVEHSPCGASRPSPPRRFVARALRARHEGLHGLALLLQRVVSRPRRLGLGELFTRATKCAPRRP
jgi:hypothetical protein